MSVSFFSVISSSITWPVVGVVLALVLFDGIKEGVLLPLAGAAWERAGVRGARARAGAGAGGAGAGGAPGSVCVTTS